MNPITEIAPLLLSGGHSHPNFLAIPVSVIAVFVIGGLWYSPLLFVKPWKKRLGIPPDAKGNPAKPMIINVIMLGIAAVAMYFIMQYARFDDWVDGVELGLGLGLAFVATSLGTVYAYQSRGFVLWLIDASYQVLCLVVMGAIMGAWQS
jgi:hypothetical protein